MLFIAETVNLKIHLVLYTVFPKSILSFLFMITHKFNYYLKCLDSNYIFFIFFFVQLKILKNMIFILKI